MAAPRIIRQKEAPLHPLHGDGRIRRLIYPVTVGSQALFVGLAQVPPGEAPHVFHKHDRETAGNVELEYAPSFEEFYYVIEGSASMQWKTDDGTLHECPVAAGDAIYMPPGVFAHRIFNSGDSLLRVLYGGTPPARVTPLGVKQSPVLSTDFQTGPAARVDR